jgi:UDP-N-acetylmuramate--alanine ligase
VHHVSARDRVADALLDLVQPGDLVITLGAGDIHKCADELLGMMRAGVRVPQVH